MVVVVVIVAVPVSTRNASSVIIGTQRTGGACFGGIPNTKSDLYWVALILT
jgi:hypothetical protein